MIRLWSQRGSFVARRRLGGWVAVVLALVVACGPAVDNSQVKLPPVVETTAVGPGDVFFMQIVGEKELPDQYQIASDGSVDLPYLGRMNVRGLEPQEISKLIREGLIKKQILTDPTVIVRVEAYESKKVTLLGQVQKPGSFPHSAGLTLIQAVSLAGGFTAIANQDRVQLKRTLADGGTTTVTISAEAIVERGSPDIPLQSGDQIYVHERIF